MIISMTGFGKSETKFQRKKLSVEIRSLNSKNIDLSFRIPYKYREIESKIRTKINGELSRGKIDLLININLQDEDKSSSLNYTVIKKYIDELKKISDSSEAELLKMAIRLPESIKIEKEDISKEEKKILFKIIDRAIIKLNQYRTSEGKSIEKDFKSRIKSIYKLVKNVDKLAPKRKEKIRKKIEVLSKQNLKEIDNKRMEQEIFYFIEKLDINEEIVRLKSNLKYFEKIMSEKSPNGKKLTFITQEIGREINTLGSKANDEGLQKTVVEMKDELEKIKEQLLNVL
ncbi:MAG: YicC family protein [Flavobacteriaceae bacterium TMED206]|nr:MAG: YicC family protein [Flavobacteriaceae bacterium TMED206]